MDNLAGLGVALDAMRSDDEHRYDHHAMRSALPNAPTIERATLRERVRMLWMNARKRVVRCAPPQPELQPWPSRSRTAAATTQSRH